MQGFNIPKQITGGMFDDIVIPSIATNGYAAVWNNTLHKIDWAQIPTVAPGGSSGYIQYNNAGAFGASGVYWNSVNSLVGIGTEDPDTPLHILSGSAGSVSAIANTVLTLESSSHAYINFLAGSGGAAGIIVGQSTNNNVTALSYNRVIASAWDITSTTAGANSLFVVQNTNNSNMSSNATITTLVGGASAGDPTLKYTINAVQDWTTGVDNSDSDKFKIASAAGLGTAQDRLAIDTSGNVGIGTTSPSQKLDVSGSVNVATALIVPVIRPAANSTTAWKVTKADGTTAVVTVDTTNSRVGVNGAPSETLTVAGNTGSPGALTLGIRNSSASGDSRFTLFNSDGNYMAAQVTGASYPLPSIASFFTTGLNALGFVADGGVASGGSAYIYFSAGGYANEAMRVLSTKSVAIGQTSATALLDLAASTTSRSSLRIRPGTFPTGANRQDGDFGYVTSGRLMMYRGTTEEIVATGVQATGGSTTAGASYTSAEQTMLQRAYDACRAFGLLS